MGRPLIKWAKVTKNSHLCLSHHSCEPRGIRVTYPAVHGTDFPFLLWLGFGFVAKLDLEPIRKRDVPLLSEQTTLSFQYQDV